MLALSHDYRSQAVPPHCLPRGIMNWNELRMVSGGVGLQFYYSYSHFVLNLAADKITIENVYETESITELKCTCRTLSITKV